MSAIQFGKILLLSLALAVGLRYLSLSMDAVKQDHLAKDLCGLVSLPLETGLLRDTYEGLESALRARGEIGTCVSVTDHGRSYSPDCFQSGASYRTVMCRAEGNTGVRAAISFVNPGVFERPLILWWLALCIVIITLMGIARSVAKYLVEVFSGEVTALLLDSDPKATSQTSWLKRLARFTMEKLGVASKISEQATMFRTELRGYEERVTQEATSRMRLEEEAKNSKLYVEKVQQIRHDIRSPLSSLQSVYAKLKTEETSTIKALATAIRRIQILMDDLNEVDRVREQAKLVIAEVAIEETALVLHGKFHDTKSAILTVNYGQEALSPIMVGAEEFKSAIENLLENALDAISIGGHVQVSIQNKAGQCVIAVEDDGCGISEENLAKLFTHGGSFGKINGLGLGLYHTKKNIESWGGTIACTRLERGVRFTISIPLMQTGVVFSGLPSDRQIKIIDDDHQVPEALIKAGYNVIEGANSFATGRTVLAGGTSEDFSILVDHRLDRGHLGTDLIAEQTERRRIFLCTNDFDDLELVKAARQIGVKIIPKPLCFLGLYRTLFAKPTTV